MYLCFMTNVYFMAIVSLFYGKCFFVFPGPEAEAVYPNPKHLVNCFLMHLKMTSMNELTVGSNFTTKKGYSNFMHL